MAVRNEWVRKTISIKKMIEDGSYAEAILVARLAYGECPADRKSEFRVLEKAARTARAEAEAAEAEAAPAAAPADKK